MVHINFQEKVEKTKMIPKSINIELTLEEFLIIKGLAAATYYEYTEPVFLKLCQIESKYPIININMNLIKFRESMKEISDMAKKLEESLCYFK